MCRFRLSASSICVLASSKSAGTSETRACVGSRPAVRDPLNKRWLSWCELFQKARIGRKLQVNAVTYQVAAVRKQAEPGQTVNAGHINQSNSDSIERMVLLTDFVGSMANRLRKAAIIRGRVRSERNVTKSALAVALLAR
jgi:hypothetical protein